MFNPVEPSFPNNPDVNEIFTPFPDDSLSWNINNTPSVEQLPPLNSELSPQDTTADILLPSPSTFDVTDDVIFGMTQPSEPTPEPVLTTAQDLGILENAQILQDELNNANPDDFYRFEITTTVDIDLVLYGLSSDADLELIQDLNGNGAVEYDEVLAGSYAGGSQTEQISRMLEPGVYYLNVTQYSGETAYNLLIDPEIIISPPDLAGNSLSTAFAIDSVNSLQTLQDFVSVSDTDDFYRFNLDTPSQLNGLLYGLEANATLSLIQDINNNGIVDPGEVLNTAEDDVIEMTEMLGPGTYYLQVSYLDSQTPYNLTLDSTEIIDNIGNTVATAHDLIALHSPQTVSDFIASFDLEDYYHFNLPETSDFSVALLGLTADADVELVQDINANGIIEAGEVIAGSYTLGSEPEALQVQDLAPGSYYVRVMQFSGNTDYTLHLLPDLYSFEEGYGGVNAATAVAWAVGRPNPFPEVPEAGKTSWGVEWVQAPEVWAQGYTGAGVTVAVIDSGVDYNHPDLINNIWTNPGEIPDNGLDDDGNGYVDDVQGWDFVDSDNDPIDLDSGHGTHVAGTIAASNNNSVVTGVAPDATIMPVRVLGPYSGSSADVANGIRYAVDNGADVINLSLSRTFPNELVESTLQYAAEQGVVVVMAAGNDEESEPGYPARYADELGIAVGAIGIENALAEFSNEAGVLMDYVVAPGVDIFSTLPNNSYDFAEGTSMATPHTAGVVALMLSANPNLTPTQVEDIIVQTANPIGVVV
jgi:hypothetical protein